MWVVYGCLGVVGYWEMGGSVQRCTALKLVEHNYSSVAQLPEASGSRRSRRSAGKYAAFRGKDHGQGQEQEQE